MFLKKVGNQIALAFALMMVVYAINILYNLFGLYQTEKARDRHEFFLNSEKQLRNASLAERKIRSYMLEIGAGSASTNRDKGALKFMKSNVQQLGEVMSKLEQVYAELDDNHKEKFEHFDSYYRKIKEHVSTVEQLATSNDREAIKLLYFNQFIRDYMDMRKPINELRKDMKVRVETHKEEIYTNSTKTLSGYIIFFSFFLVFMVLSGFLLTRNIKNQLGCEPYEAAVITRKLAAGEFSISLDKKQEKGLYKDLKTTIGALRKVIERVVGISNDLSYTSNQLAKGAQQISEGANDQAASAEEVSASMEEMSASIEINTDGALETEKISLSAANEIDNSNQSVQETAQGVKQINEKIGIIDEIVSQTNILALNAAVEASRAGEHGKGFAVVAAEVRKLAENSKVAAEEIVEIAGRILKVANDSGEMLSAVVPDIMKTSDLVKQIANSSSEQNTSSVQINNALQQLNTVIQQNATNSEEMASGSDELARMSTELKKLISFFRI